MFDLAFNPMIILVISITLLFFWSTSGDRRRRPEDYSLATDIISNFALAKFHDRPLKYLPNDRLKALVTESRVHRELKGAGVSPYEHLLGYRPPYPSELAIWITKKARKLFAIAVYCELDASQLLLSMRIFHKHVFTDDSLPLPDPETSLAPRHIFPPEIWRRTKLTHFHEQQWKFNTPVFYPGKYEYDLPAESIFPFVTHGIVPKDGAFSSVYRVKIHKAHNEWPDLEEIALKELKVPKVLQDEDRSAKKQAWENDAGAINQAWENEAGALEAIKKLKHKHIVECIAAIRRGNSRYFMFPWADGDSLRDFWNHSIHRVPNARIITEVIFQIKGIADALDKLHNFDGGRVIRRGSVGDITLTVPDLNGVHPPLSQERDQPKQVTLHNEVDDYHNAENARSIRHGDLKPENILRFLGLNSDLGILKIADMGLAKRHVVATQLRSQATTTRFSTRRYEAPETVTTTLARSRLYDTWSMGCITFEFIIWLLYGNDELQNLYKQIEANAAQTCQYYEVVTASDEDPGGARVHPVVSRWMDFVQEKDPECANGVTSAISELLKIVREMLLVVPLPPNRRSGVERGRQLAPAFQHNRTRYRATAAELRDALNEILTKVDAPGYAFSGGDRTGIKPPSPTSSQLALPTVDHGVGVSFPLPSSNFSLHGQTVGGASGYPVVTDYTMPPRQGWEYHIDNKFAEKLLESYGRNFLAPYKQSLTKLCNTCTSFNFWRGGFSIEEAGSDLAARSVHCQLCKMLDEIFQSIAETRGDVALFVRSESKILLTGNQLPVLSIVRTSNLTTQLPIQLGFPELPAAGSKVFFHILRQWLTDCDTNHQDCKPVDTRHRLPTRLIDVGSCEDPVLRLVDTRQEEPLSRRYIALSHPWGDTSKYDPFCTLVSNEATFRHYIPEKDLPGTFTDAVISARELCVRYLWIDSLCIRQGVDSDFDEQSKTMEDVFSGAYCVLAASRASNQRDGFLGPRPQREYVTIQQGHDKPFYVCKTIDNFGKDVIEGSLNKRGWVLQERVLARRTIYFTKNQTYFECGAGVRCETLTTMYNNLAKYIGDPHFPDKVVKANKAGKITSFQNLFRQYSRLDFTRDQDRPFAIAGLEKRLRRALDTKGDYGIFDDTATPDGGLFHRSLLWQKGEEQKDSEYLTPISFTNNVRIPTWSWMAYKGGIDYTDPPFRSANWETRELKAPWTRGNLRHTDTGPQQGDVALLAMVRTFAVAGRRGDEVRLSYDTGRTSASDGQAAQCVIVAKAKEARSDSERRHYVLLVTPTRQAEARGEKVYERVGAGYMLGKFIRLEEPGVAAKIV
ncbi:hypothetical protein ACN47E_007506 [Coniothyrium glycines]